MEKLSKKDMMQRIVAYVGSAEAIKLVSDAYSAEILANRIGRMEAASQSFIKQARPISDMMEIALERVLAVCELTAK
jgi:hypothetical protein